MVPRVINSCLSSYFVCLHVSTCVLLQFTGKLYNNCFGANEVIISKMRVISNFLVCSVSIHDLWEWAIALHGRLLIPSGWLQVTCVGHCSICQSKIFLAHRQCSIKSENLINCGTALSKDLAVSG